MYLSKNDYFYYLFKIYVPAQGQDPCSAFPMKSTVPSSAADINQVAECKSKGALKQSYLMC